MYANADSEHSASKARQVGDVQGDNILPSQIPLPSLPSNAQYIFHSNQCFHWGTFGWALGKSVADTATYNYIIFMNSSVRGPLLPAYWPVSSIEWQTMSCYKCIFKPCIFKL